MLARIHGARRLLHVGHSPSSGSSCEAITHQLCSCLRSPPRHVQLWCRAGCTRACRWIRCCARPCLGVFVWQHAFSCASPSSCTARRWLLVRHVRARSGSVWLRACPGRGRVQLRRCTCPRSTRPWVQLRIHSSRARARSGLLIWPVHRRPRPRPRSRWLQFRQCIGPRSQLVIWKYGRRVTLLGCRGGRPVQHPERCAADL